jgi:hypothetical protein
MQWTTCLLGVTYGAWQKVNISSAFFEQGRWKPNIEWGSAHSAWLNTHTHTHTHTHQSTRVHQNLLRVTWNESQIATIIAERYNEATLDDNTRLISFVRTDTLMTSVNNTSHYADMTGDMEFLSSEIISFRPCKTAAVSETLLFSIQRAPGQG